MYIITEVRVEMREKQKSTAKRQEKLLLMTSGYPLSNWLKYYLKLIYHCNSLKKSKINFIT